MNNVSDKERADFPKKIQWMYNNLFGTMHKPPTILEILTAIMVMEKEDPTAIVELMKEMEKMKNE